MEAHDETNAVFTPVNTASIPQPVDQGIISSFTSYYRRNAFHKAIDATDGDSSHGSGQSNLKTFQIGLTILDAIKNIPDSWEEVKISA